MKKLGLIGAGLGLFASSGLVWMGNVSKAPPLNLGQHQQHPQREAVWLDSTFLETNGVVGAGGDLPLLARTSGRVKNLFFSPGDYARRGQLLVTLSNHTFVTAPRAGFLGPNLLSIGQYISRLTPVTTISRYSYLVVLLLLPPDWQGHIHPGDSVRVWATAPPARIVSGTVGYIGHTDSTNLTVEIIMTSRAPFRIGELAWVRLQAKHTQVAVR